MLIIDSVNNNYYHASKMDWKTLIGKSKRHASFQQPSLEQTHTPLRPVNCRAEHFCLCFVIGPIIAVTIEPIFVLTSVVVGWRRGKMTPGPWVRWSWMKWGWCGPAGGQGQGGQQREWRLRREGVKVDLQRGQVAKWRKPCQELGDLLGCRPHIPRGQIREMSGTAEEVGHRVVGGAAIGTGGVIGPAYRVAVGLKPWTINGRSGADRGRCGMTVVAVVRLGQLEGGGAISTLLGAWDRMVSSIIQPKRRRLARG